MTYRALNGLAPNYLQDLLQVYQPARSLRSSGDLKLVVPGTCLKSYGGRAFSVKAPCLWNSLTLYMRTMSLMSTFKKVLKTHLFQMAFADLLITKRISNCIKSVFMAAGISDHLAVISEIDCCKTKWNNEKISFRKINKIDYESFHSDILSSDLIKKPEKDLSALCQQYDPVLSSILDKHAPVSTKTMPRKPQLHGWLRK